MEKAYITRLFLTHWKPRKLSITVFEHSNDRRPWVCNRLIAFTFTPFWSLVYMAIGSMHIGVGSWLLVSTVMGNPRASVSGASNWHSLHAFFVSW